MSRGYTGEIAGVTFEDGTPTDKSVAALADPRQALHGVLMYARRHGLVIEDERLIIAEQTDPEPPDPRKLGFLGSGISQVGTHLRDASVAPRPKDFLPPTNAGKANPHGPEVVAPELHGSQGTRPVKGGKVSDEPAAQEASEQAHAAEVLDSDGGTDDGSRSEGQSDDRTPHIEAFLDRKADEVIADVPSLTDDDRALALTVEMAGKARVTVLRALDGEA